MYDNSKYPRDEPIAGVVENHERIFEIFARPPNWLKIYRKIIYFGYIYTPMYSVPRVKTEISINRVRDGVLLYTVVYHGVRLNLGTKFSQSPRYHSYRRYMF